MFELILLKGKVVHKMVGLPPWFVSLDNDAESQATRTLVWLDT